MKLELTDQEAEFLIRVLVSNHAEDNQDFESNITDTGTGGLLISKLLNASEYKLMTAYKEARKDRWADNNRITDYLFMGNGWHSIVERNKLHKRIDAATGWLGGMQQNGGMGTEFDEEWDKRGKQFIKEVALDVLTAFGLTVEDLK
jgi:hypothetical protein